MASPTSPTLTPPRTLTPSAERLCHLIMQGYTSKEIAHELGSTRNAVEISVHRLLKSTNTRSRSHLVAWYLGYIPQNL